MEGYELCLPQINTSCAKLKLTWSDTLVTSVLLSLISVLTAILNLLVIISISHFRQLHTPTNLLLLSLAVSDFFVSFFVFIHVLIIDGCWTFGDLLCALFVLFEYLMTSTSVGNMVLISVDRYEAICDPLHYPTKVTPKRVQICVCLCWMCSLLWNSVMLRGNLTHPGKYNSCSGNCLIFVSYAQQVADLTTTFIIPITLIVVLYTRVFAVALSQARAMRSHVAAVTQRGSQTVTVKKSELKAARSLGIVITVFLICLFPFFCDSIVGEDTVFNPASVTFVICLFYFNSCLNPLMYAFFYPWFRRSIRLIVTLQILQPGSRNTDILQRNSRKDKKARTKK